jgi:multicomponent Na+:H+ antiporter subunit G
MAIVLDGLSWILLGAGGVLTVTGAIGLLRFPDFFTRLHAVSITETLATWAILLGLALQSGLTQTTLKLALIWLILLFTGPTATHALAKAALHGGLVPMADEEEA